LTNPIDRAIQYVAPTWACRRLEARARLELAGKIERRMRGRRYEGAANSNRTAGWMAGPHSANAEIGGALGVLRNRTRDLVRNNGWASRAVRHLTNTTVGSVGMLPTPLGDDARGRELADLWESFMGSTEIDPQRKLTFAGIQNLAARSQFESGEVLLRRRWRRPGDGLELPFQIQMLEADHIDTSKTENYGQNTIIQGVEYTPIGSIAAIWLYTTHPGESLPLRGWSLESQRVPARDLVHFFEPLRVGQVRGVPRGCPSLIPHRDFADYADATLVRAKIAALTVAFITKVGDVDGFAGQELDENDHPVEEMVPGMLEYLRPGEDVSFNSPIDHTSIEEFSRVSCRSIATGWDVSYEALTGDLSNVTFSSAKIGRITENESAESFRRLHFVPQVCHVVWGWFQEAAQLAGLVETGKHLRASWTPPRREMVQPIVEIKAMKEQINAGLLTVSEALRRLGYNPKLVAEEMKRDLELLGELGISTDLAVKIEAQAKETPADDEPPLEGDAKAARALARNGARAISHLAGAKA
jgi:lambda family phage portal protein